MQVPIYDAAGEQELMSHLWSPQIRDDPEAFVLFCFTWGREGTPLPKETGPRRWQRKVLRELAKHIADNKPLDEFKSLKDATRAGRGIGKSALVAWLIIWMLTTRIGSSVIVSANTENQLVTKTWPELTKWLGMMVNSHWFEHAATTVKLAKWLTEAVARDLKRETRLWAANAQL